MSLFHKNETETSLTNLLDEEILYNPVLNVQIYLDLEKDFYVK